MSRSILTACNVVFRAQVFPHIRHINVLSPVCTQKITAENQRNRNFSSKIAEPAILEEPGLIKKFIKSVGWFDQARTRLKLSGYYLYECLADNIVFTEWFSECEIPDTFSSWFAVTELHAWMLMVRTMSEDVNSVGQGERYKKDGEGRHVRNCIVEALWADVGNRIKVLENANQSIAKKQVIELSEQFQAALISYDEGLSDDKVLAAAIWRRIFNSELVDAEHVEKVVKLVRKQITELDKMPWELLIKEPKIPWIGIKEV